MSDEPISCDCQDWKDSLPELNKFIYLGISRRQYYEGKPFQYCPWCGKKRKTQDEESPCGSSTACGKCPDVNECY